MTSTTAPAAGPAKKRISQVTFDETVRENMEEFELEREEAVTDAVRQFTSQGVDLGNICVALHECDGHWLEEVDAQLTVLTMCLDNGVQVALPASWDRVGTVVALRALHAALTNADADKIANARTLMGTKGTVNMVARLWQEDKEEPAADGDTAAADARLLALAVTQALCSGGSAGEASRDAFWPTSMRMLCNAAQQAYSQQNRAFYLPFLTLVRVLCTRAEDNKVSFVRYGGLDLLVGALKEDPWASDRNIVCESCGALKAVTAVDDFRKDFSASHTHTRALVGKGAIPLLLQSCHRFRTDLDTAAAALAALRNLANNDESVNQIASEGGLDLAVRALEAHCSHPPLAQTAIGLFRNVSADDRHKTSLCNNGAAELMLKAMRKHGEAVKIQEHGLATMGAMALRSPENCRQLVGLGAVLVILQALRQHAEVRSVQRQACLAIRNMVSRVPELGEEFLEGGAEPLLRLAGRYQESVDEAYAALRDLKCDVKRVTVDPVTGKVQDVEQFGSTKSCFNPVFESSNDIEGAVEAAISAPSNSYRF
eukprot:evm.model.NODE_30348_length_10312_cov_22.853859.3